ncbi:hypothetical protein [Povalibacter sp.]
MEILFWSDARQSKFVTSDESPDPDRADADIEKQQAAPMGVIIHMQGALP